MGRVNTPVLTAEQRKELEHGFRKGLSHCFRQRCQSILLKADGRDSKEVGAITGLCAVSVNSWLKRYKFEGLSGLQTKPGRGRKAVLSYARRSVFRYAELEAKLLLCETMTKYY